MNLNVVPLQGFTNSFDHRCEFIIFLFLKNCGIAGNLYSSDIQAQGTSSG
jgi:hypothetical protein